MSPVDSSAVGFSSSNINVVSKAEHGTGEKRGFETVLETRASNETEEKKKKKHATPRGDDATTDNKTTNIASEQLPSVVNRSPKKQRAKQSREDTKAITHTLTEDVVTAKSDGEKKAKKRKRENKSVDVHPKQGDITEEAIALLGLVPPHINGNLKDDKKVKKRKHKEDHGEKAVIVNSTENEGEKKPKKKRKKSVGEGEGL
ncbi:hypothetical protein B0F90DRAFT_1697611 [Multifurca ochricompacta]|uniref:Uncharacterized protein n=1 Tax=Multifurca ochricompacta TaxID=376703 RepID=A0AAD4QQN5_9AGAM|nr:hypothetical protein B0F90DRAFT_1697611 [Multifurca ochricompacta]